MNSASTNEPGELQHPPRKKSRDEEEDGAGECPETAGDEVPSMGDTHYEYLDHTADVQLHSWGATLEEAIQQVIIAMYGYMVEDISAVECLYSMDFDAAGHDMHTLLYTLMDSCLYHFNAEPYFVGRVCRVLSMKRGDGAGSEEDFKIHLRAWGESYDRAKHPPGTEIKAITYSNMQVLEPGAMPEGTSDEGDHDEEDEEEGDNSTPTKKGAANIFVIVDI